MGLLVRGTSKILSRYAKVNHGLNAVAIRISVANMSKFDDREHAMEDQYIYNQEKQVINRLKTLLSQREANLKKLKASGASGSNEKDESSESNEKKGDNKSSKSGN